MTEPSGFFRQHHAVEAPAIDGAHFRQHWSVVPKLEQLKTDRAISWSVWLAAVEFRRVLEIVLMDQWKPPSFDHVGGGGGFDPGPRRIDALKRKAIVRGHIGSWAVDLLELHLVADLPWEDLGRRYGVHRSTARRWTIHTLEVLPYVVWRGNAEGL